MRCIKKDGAERPLALAFNVAGIERTAGLLGAREPPCVHFARELEGVVGRQLFLDPFPVLRLDFLPVEQALYRGLRVVVALL